MRRKRLSLILKPTTLPTQQPFHPAQSAPDKNSEKNYMSGKIDNPVVWSAWLDSSEHLNRKHNTNDRP